MPYIQQQVKRVAPLPGSHFDAQGIRQLLHHNRDRQSECKAAQHGSRDKGSDLPLPTQAQHRQQHPRKENQTQQSRQVGSSVGCHVGRRQHRCCSQRGSRRCGGNHRKAAGAQHRVDQQAHYHRCQGVGDGQVGQSGVGHSLRQQQAGHAQAGHHVPGAKLSQGQVG